MAGKFCGECGKKLAEGARFCTGCGRSVAGAPVAAPAPPELPIAPVEPAPPAPPPPTAPVPSPSWTDEEARGETAGYRPDFDAPEARVPRNWRYAVLFGAACLIVLIGILAVQRLGGSGEDGAATDEGIASAANENSAATEEVAYEDVFLSDADETLFVLSAANMRDRPTSEDTTVLRQLRAGEEVRGRWVRGAIDSAARWLRVEGPQGVGYIWDQNLNTAAIPPEPISAISNTNTPRAAPTQPRISLPPRTCSPNLDQVAHMECTMRAEADRIESRTGVRPECVTIDVGQYNATSCDVD